MFDHHLGLGPVEGLQMGPEGAMQVVVVLSDASHSTQPHVPPPSPARSSGQLRLEKVQEET